MIKIYLVTYITFQQDFGTQIFDNEEEAKNYAKEVWGRYNFMCGGCDVTMEEIVLKGGKIMRNEGRTWKINSKGKLKERGW